MKFACPHCNQRIEAGDEFAGQVVECPSCKGEIAIPASSFKYWAFLSYSHQDNLSVRTDGSRDCVRWAEWLHKELETYRIPTEFLNRQTRTGESMPRRFFPVFQDEKELPINADLGESIRVALERSRFLIVICSPRSAVSRYVNEEVRYFKQMGRGHHILTLMVDGEPNASWGQKAGAPPQIECFCPALRHPLGLDGLEDIQRFDPQEPIAGDVRIKLSEQIREATNADVRHGHRAVLEQMKLKLIAGLIGVGFDELVQRDKVRTLEESRRQARVLRRWLIAVSALALMALVAGGVAFTQKRRADAARLSVLHRLYVAEFLQIQRAWDDGDFERVQNGLEKTRPAQGDPDFRHWEWYYLRGLRQNPIRTFTLASPMKIPSGSRPALAWSPDGNWWAVGSEKRWNGLNRSVSAAAFDLLDARSGQSQHSFPNATPFAWNADGSCLAAQVNERIMVWKFPSFEVISELKGHNQAVCSLAWRPGSDQVAAGSCTYDYRNTCSGELLVWDIKAPQPSLHLKWADQGVGALEWTPDGKRITVGWQYLKQGGRYAEIGLLDPIDGHQVETFTHSTRPGDSGVQKMAWKNDGKTLAVDIYTAGEGLEFLDRGTKKFHGKIDVSDQSFAWDSTGKRLLCLGSKGRSSILKLWEPDLPRRSTVLWLPFGYRTGFAWSPNGREFAVLGMKGELGEAQVSVWDVERIHPDYQTFYMHPPNITSVVVAWSPDGRRLVSGSVEGELAVCNARSGTQISTLMMAKDEIKTTSWSPKTEELLVVSKSGKIQLWSGKKDDPSRTVNLGNEVASWACWNPHQSQFFIGTTSGKIECREPDNEKPIYELGKESSPIVFTVASPAREELLSVDDSGQLIVWNLAQRKPIASVHTERGGVRYAAFDHVGDRLATCGDDNVIRIWNARTLELQLTLEEHLDPVVGLSWNPADGRLASVDDGGTIWISSVEMRQGLLRIQDTALTQTEDSHSKNRFAARAVAWSPDGSRLAASGLDSFTTERRGIVHVWNTPKGVEETSAGR